MIYVDKTQLNQVEYLIGQSILGNHVLFDVDRLREIFSRAIEAAKEQPKVARSATKKSDSKKAPKKGKSDVIEQHIETMILQPSIAEKRAYLDRLDHETYERVVRTYFNIVENNLFEQLEAKH